MKKSILFLLIILLLAAGCGSQSSPAQLPAADVSNLSGTSPLAATSALKTLPLNKALSRVTKKPFGIYVTPKSSPVSPEKFSGFHTGADFETFADEQNIDVPVFAICAGQLLLKKYASGYGGVAVQSCRINDNPVTVIYGHLRLSSINQQISANIKSGSRIGVLGTGFGTETYGERKHLHLGIHKGTAINILGYVQNKTDLSNWIDPLTILK